MGNFKKILEEDSFEESLEKEINDTFDRMYETLMIGDPVKIAKKIGTKEPFQKMLEHYCSLEQYEKCGFLSKIIEKI